MVTAVGEGGANVAQLFFSSRINSALSPSENSIETFTQSIIDNTQNENTPANNLQNDNNPSITKPLGVPAGMFIEDIQNNATTNIEKFLKEQEDKSISNKTDLKENEQGEDKKFSKYDLNKDGTVTIDEIKTVENAEKITKNDYFYQNTLNSDKNNSAKNENLLIIN